MANVISTIEAEIRKELFGSQDLRYRDFHAALIPTVDKETIIGVRMPVLRKIAKMYEKNSDTEVFLSKLPHYYYEENNLHGIIIGKIQDFDCCIAELERFLPHINNWATCDLLTPKCFEKNREKALENIEKWISSERTYTVRFAIEMLMKFFLGVHFDGRYPKLVADVHNEDYYVKMMIAWYFATALAFNYEQTIPFIENNCLEKWTHNKTIQKSVESFRITDEQKIYLKSLKIK